MTEMTDKDRQQIHDDFDHNVNMNASELKKWLDSEEAKSVGIKTGTTNDKKTESGGSESTGHAMGRTIVTILGKKKADLTDEDYAHMKKVNGYVARHSAQRPSGDISDTRWRYSLMNWGNDPTK